MSYQIYYDRAYVRVGEKFIPLVNSGSNNCFEYGLNGRHICEKNWNVQNWQRSGQFIFTEKEIREIARDYDRYNRESVTMFKSRNRCFKPGEMERWLINGMKNAYTIEEYVSFGNSFYVLDYSPSESKAWKRHPFASTSEFMAILDNLKDVRELEIKLGDNRQIYRPKAERVSRKLLCASNNNEYYVLKGEHAGSEIFFCGLSRRGGVKYTHYGTGSSAKPFLTEKDALRYLKKYHDRLVKRYNFIPKKITKAS